MAAGMGVTEFNETGAAAFEIRQLWNWIDNKLQPKVKRYVNKAA
jgi:chromosome partitioning protein